MPRIRWCSCARRTSTSTAPSVPRTSTPAPAWPRASRRSAAPPPSGWASQPHRRRRVGRAPRSRRSRSSRHRQRTARSRVRPSSLTPPISLRASCRWARSTGPSRSPGPCVWPWRRASRERSRTRQPLWPARRATCESGIPQGCCRSPPPSSPGPMASPSRRRSPSTGRRDVSWRGSSSSPDPSTQEGAHMPATRREFLRTSGVALATGGVFARPRSARAQARPGVPSDPVKIGVLASRAGVTAPVGQAGLRGTEWWAERVNRGGGILGRRVQLVVEEETNPKDTVERYRKLVLQEKVDVVVGVISTGVSLALGSVAEEMDTPWLAWDGTTQKGVEETIPNPKWAFRSVDNEVEAIVGGILTAKYFKGVRTIAGINNDYSYGHDCWESYQAVLKRYGMEVKPVLELFPKLGETNFTSHIAAIQQAKPDLLMCSFWSADATIFMKQAAAVGLLTSMKGVFTTAGGVHDSLKKEFTPEGLLLGYNSMYFDDPKGSALLRQFTQEYKAKHNEYPAYESDHAYFCVESYKAAVEKAYQAAGQWPGKAQVVKALEGIEVESLSGKRSWREDHIQMCNFFQGITTHKNAYDFVTINPVEVISTKQAMKPAGTKLFDWIGSWKL